MAVGKVVGIMPAIRVPAETVALAGLKGLKGLLGYKNVAVKKTIISAVTPATIPIKMMTNGFLLPTKCLLAFDKSF